MGKRSDFERRPQDKYYTPLTAVKPLLPFLQPYERYVEPCAGNGALIRGLAHFGHNCVFACDIEPDRNAPPIIVTANALNIDYSSIGYLRPDKFITNPPWTREILHPLIWHLMSFMPTWLLFDADWGHTGQSRELLRHCSDMVSVGRVKWIADSKHSGKDNAAWYLFDQAHVDGPRFHNVERGDA